jgi:hypothetical protein
MLASEFVPVYSQARYLAALKIIVVGAGRGSVRLPEAVALRHIHKASLARRRAHGGAA